MGQEQVAGRWTTPYGPNVRYTVQMHVVGEDRAHLGSVRPVDRHVEYRVVTPLGELKAVAIAALLLAEHEPDAIYREIELVKVEHEFTVEPSDYRDDESRAR